MKCKNKEVFVKGIYYDDETRKVHIERFRCIITNDEQGKTLSIDDGTKQFTIPFNPIEKFLL